jgi:hypothetical protein
MPPPVHGGMRVQPHMNGCLPPAIPPAMPPAMPYYVPPLIHGGQAPLNQNSQTYTNQIVQPAYQPPPQQVQTYQRPPQQVQTYQPPPQQVQTTVQTNVAGYSGGASYSGGSSYSGGTSYSGGASSSGGSSGSITNRGNSGSCIGPDCPQDGGDDNVIKGDFN